MKEFYSIEGEAFYVCELKGCTYSKTRHDPCTCPEIALVGDNVSIVTCTHEIRAFRKRTKRLEKVLTKARDRLRVVVADWNPWTDADRVNLEYLEAMLAEFSAVLVKGDKR